MSRPRATLVDAAVTAINSRDWDAALAFLAPDFEYDLTRTDSPMRGVHPRAQMRKLFEEFLEPWESVRYEPLEVVEAGDVAVVPFRTHFTGRHGIEMQTDAAWVWTFRDDLVAGLALFQTRPEAFAAAGLAEAPSTRS